MTEPASVLVLAHGTVGPDKQGPGIRAWHLARGLASRHRVTIAAPQSCPGLVAGLPVVPSSRASLIREAGRHDAVVGAFLPPYAIWAARRHGAAVIADLYDPVESELAALEPTRKVLHRIAHERRMRTFQLAHCDAVLCASEAQRAEILGELRRPGPPVTVMPFGVEDPAPAAAANPLRERLGIPAEAPLVLWWGGAWKWLDPAVVVRAFAAVSRELPDAQLVFAIGPPRDRTREQDGRAALVDAIRSSPVPAAVDLLEEWIPYAERAAWLRDADVGVTMHHGGAEASLAARARHLDYLWAGLPCVLASGEEVAGQFADAGFATLVAPGDEHTLGAALTGLLGDRPRRATAARRAAALAVDLRWPRVIEAAMAAIDQALAERRDAPRRAGPAAVGFYAHRAADLLR